MLVADPFCCKGSQLYASCAATLLVNLEHLQKCKMYILSYWIGLGWVIGPIVRIWHQGKKEMNGVSSVGVFVRDPSPYLSEFRRKPPKTPND